MKTLLSLPFRFSLACVLAASAPAANVTVSTTTDEVNGNTTSIANLIATPGGAGISLREAIIAANNTAGADVITLPAGTYTLTIANAGGLNEDACTQGDLDVTDSLTINGAGAASTIVQAGTTAANGIDKVFAINPLCDHAVAFTMSGVTVRFGRNTQPNGAADFSFTGGGMDFCGNGASTFTLKDCVVTNNSNVNGYGGGMNIDEVAPATSVVTITNTMFANNTAGYWGGGLNIFGDDVQVTISAGTFTGNQTIGAGGAGSQGGGINIRITGTTAGTTPFVTINNNSVISNNTAHGYGGGVCVAGAGNQNVTIQNSSITGKTVLNNGAIASQGGGLYHDNNAARTTTLNNVLIANNHADSLAGAAGGGVFVGSGVFNMTYSRIVSNTAPSGVGLAQAGGTATVTNNWWGTNAPAALMSGTVAFTPWLMLRLAANPTTIFIPNPATLTATFLTNSAGTFVPAANLGVLTGVPVAFNNAVLGTLSGAQATLQSSGTATATFTANAAGAGSANAVVDGQPVTAGITILPSVTAINRAQTTPTNLNSVQWTVTFNSAVSGVTAGNFSVINTGLGGLPAISSVTAVGGAPATSWIVTASTGSGTGTLGLNMVNSSGVSAAIGGLPFTGQVYTIDLVAPDTSITAQPLSPTNSTSASFSFTGSDTGVGVASFQCQLDGAAYTNCTSPVNFTGLSSASHTFNVRAIDGVGNTDASPATVTWIVDTIPPTVTCSTNVIVTANGYCPSNVNYTVSISDNLAISLATTNPASGSAFAVGTNTVTLTARDTAGNTNFCTFKVIVLPGAAPQLSIVRSGTNVVVSWTNLFPCYTLQFAPVLASNSWSTYPGPFTTNSGKIFVTNTAPFTNRFFRLKF